MDSIPWNDLTAQHIPQTSLFHCLLRIILPLILCLNVQGGDWIRRMHQSTHTHMPITRRGNVNLIVPCKRWTNITKGISLTQILVEAAFVASRFICLHSHGNSYTSTSIHSVNRHTTEFRVGQFKMSPSHSTLTWHYQLHHLIRFERKFALS